MMHINNFRSFNNNSTSQLILVRFFFGISWAFIDTIWSVYMKSYGFSDSTIGFINAFLILISIIFLFNCVSILEKFSERKSFIFSSFLLILILISLGFTNSIFIFLILAIILTLSNILRRNAFEILFKDNCKQEKLILTESILSVIVNIGWFLGPIIAGFILVKYGFSIIFFISAFLSLISLIMFFKIKTLIKKEIIYKKKSFKILFLNFFKEKDLHLPYLMSIGSSFWWGFIFIYVPLFIYDSKIGNEYIGIFIGLSQLPLIIFEYFAGKSAQKNGFKTSFSMGFFFMGIFAILSFIYSNNIYIVMGLLIAASIPMSFVEPLRFTYLFSKIKSNQNEDEIIPLFSSSMAMGSLLAKISIAVLLLFVIKDYAYLFAGIMMFLFSLIALKIK